MFAASVLVLTLLGSPAAETPEASLRLAQNAFAYRDFERVVSTLYPWLHPLRLKTEADQIEARYLVGVSLFVVNREAEAEAEFTELLELDPSYQLDPFLVPPPVVQRFEQIRAKLFPEQAKPTLKPPPPDPTRFSSPVRVKPPPRAAMFLPFGTPQFVLGESGAGVLYGWAQLASLGLNFGAYLKGLSSPQGSDSLVAWTITQYVGLAGFAVAWTLSAIDGNQSLSALQEAQETQIEADLEAQARIQADAIDAASRFALPPFAGPRLSLSFRF